MADSDNATKVFISYSRKDIEFVRRLNGGLDALGIDAWVDWEGIPLSSDWMAEITRAIEGADAFLFIISPDSLDSKFCGDELALAIQFNKKLIPILHREFKKGAVLHEKISSTNWVYLRSTDDFDATMPKLVEAISTDLDWVREHTRLLTRAREWEKKNRSGSSLLMGGDLREAEEWLNQAAGSKSREVLPLQMEYIVASRKNAVRTQRIVLGSVLVALVVAIALAIYALQQSQIAIVNSNEAATQRAEAVTQQAAAQANYIVAATAQVNAQINALEAKRSENTARAKGNASEAQVLQFRAGNLYGSIVKAIRSLQRESDPLAEEILRQNISLLPDPVLPSDGVTIKHGGAIRQLFFSNDGQYFIAYSDLDGRQACVYTREGVQQYCVNHDGSVNGAALIENGQVMATASDDQTVRFTNFADGKPWQVVESLQFDSRVTSLSFDEAGGIFLAVGMANGRVEVINLDAMRGQAEQGNDVNDPAVRGRFQTSISKFQNKSVITKVLFSPNGNWLAIASDQGDVLAWWFGIEISGPKHTGEIFNLAFSPDSRNLVSVAEDSTSRLMRLPQPGQRFENKNDDWAEDVAFSPDGTWFVVASDDFRVYVYDAVTGREKLRVSHSNFVLAVEVSPDGRYIASTGYDRTVRVWNAATGARIFEIPLAGIGNTIAFSPDGNLLVAGDQGGNVTMWDISELDARIGYIEFAELAHDAIISPDGNWLAVNTDDRRVWFFPLTESAAANPLAGSIGSLTAPVVHSLPFVGPGQPAVRANALTSQMGFSPNSQWLYALQPSDLNLKQGQLVLYNIFTERQYIIDHQEKGLTAGFHANGELLLLGEPSNHASLWQLGETPSLVENLALSSLTTDAPVTAFAFHPTQPWVAIGGRSIVTIWDYQTWDFVMSPQTRVNTADIGTVNLMVFNSDGSYLVAASSEGVSQVWRISEDGMQTVFGPVTDRVILAAAFNPQNTRVAMAGTSGFVHLIDLATGYEVSRVPHAGRMTSVTFSPDGARMVTVSRKTVQIWDVARLPVVEKRFLTSIACNSMLNASDIPWDVLFPDGDYQTICLNLPLGREEQ